jgi:hypothetical protein
MTDNPSALANKGAKFFDEIHRFFAYRREHEFGTALVANPEIIFILLQ